MLKKIILFCFTLFTLSSSLLAQNWLWGRQGTVAAKTNSGGYVATDKAGNAYLTGSYSTSITFGSFTLLGCNDNPFLVKYNSSGTIQWATQPGFGQSPLWCSSYSIATDISDNIYITGDFADTMFFGSDTLISGSYCSCYSTFIAKYAPNGALLWAKQSNPYYAGIVIEGAANSVTTDNKNNAYITGYFRDTISFGSYTLRSSPYSYNTFLVKYDSNGNVLWARQSNSPSYYSIVMSSSVTTDKNDNIYISGTFSDTAYFGIYTLKTWNFFPNYEGGIFLVKYDSGGNLIWAKQSNTPSTASYGGGASLITDKANNVYVTGSYKDTMNFGAYSLVSKDTAIFLTKYAPNGTVIWAKQSAGGKNWVGSSLAIDSLDHIYLIGGQGKDSIRFGGIKLSSTSQQPSFIIELDTGANAICGSMQYNGYYGSCATDPSGKYVYEASTFFNDTIFCGADTLLSTSGGDPYIARWNPCGFDEGVNKVQAVKAEAILYPNPNNGRFTIEEQGVSPPGLDAVRTGDKEQVEIYNMLGEKIYSETFSTLNSQLSIVLPCKSAGVYLYRVLNETGNLIGEGKFIIQR